MGPTWRQVLAASLTLGLVACGGSRTGDSDDDDDDFDLTPLEWSMVGVWRGSRPNDRWHYMVFHTDRTGCEWTREGDDFDRRVDELQFRDWALDADALDADFHMPLIYTGASNGERYDSDEYDAQGDRILPAGVTEIPATWIDLRIDCDGTGTHAVETDVERWGSAGNGYIGTGDPSGTGGTGGTPTGPGTGTPPGTTDDTGSGPTAPTDTGNDTGPTDTGSSTTKGPTGPAGP